MINVGSAAVEMWDDDWTVVTRDLQRSAQFEHTVLVTDDGHELLTVPADGPPAEVLFADVRNGTSPAVPTDCGPPTVGAAQPTPPLGGLGPPPPDVTRRFPR
jgi:hypothetical protein